MLLLVSFYLLFKIVHATEYSVTIMNDSELGDKRGALHTWLTFKSSNSDTKYFSFETSYIGHVLFGTDSPGECSKKSDMENRPPTESCRISVTEEQYQKLLDSCSAFCANPPPYDLTPNNLNDHANIELQFRRKREDFNCVTASNKILQEANIDTLSIAETPYDVKAIITHEGVGFRKALAYIFSYTRRILSTMPLYVIINIEDNLNVYFFNKNIFSLFLKIL